MDGAWQVGQYDCFHSIGNLLCGCCCGPCTFASGLVKTYTSWGICDCCFMFCVGGAGGYTLMRKGYFVEGSDWGDCCYVTCCMMCCGIPACHVANESEMRGVKEYKNTQRNPNPADFREGYFGFCHDIIGCLYGHCCPWCAYAGLTSDYAGTGCCYSCCCIAPALTRYDMRHQYNIDGHCCTDICAVSCCPGCGYVQMKNELQVMGPVFLPG